MTTSPVCPQERFSLYKFSCYSSPLLRKDWATRYSPVPFTLLAFTFLLLIPRKPLKSYLSVLVVISLPKSLAITFCSSLGSTLLLIENAAIDPLRLWVIKYRFLTPLPGSVALLVSEAGKEVFIFLFLILLLLLLSLWTPLLLDSCSWGTAPQLR